MSFTNFSFSSALKATWSTFQMQPHSTEGAFLPSVSSVSCGLLGTANDATFYQKIFTYFVFDLFICSESDRTTESVLSLILLHLGGWVYHMQYSTCAPWVRCSSWSLNRMNQPKPFSLLDILYIPLPAFNAQAQGLFHSSIIHNSQKLRLAKCPSIDWTDKWNVVSQRMGIIQPWKRIKYWCMLQHEWTLKTLCQVK